MESPYEFKTVKITKLHPSFGAEVTGVDFSQSLSDEVFQEIRAAMAKVNTSPSANRLCYAEYICDVVRCMRLPQDWP